jgi:transcription elongation factor GreA
MINDKPYISAEGLNRLKEKLEQLKKKRMEIAAGLEYAKSLGDLSENVEYQQKKEEQMENEATIAELEDFLSRAIIIKKQHGKKGVVEFGSAVTVTANTSEKKFIIVGNEEANPQGGKISHESPFGKVLLGKKVGEKAIVKTPKGEQEWLITRIL